MYITTNTLDIAMADRRTIFEHASMHIIVAKRVFLNQNPGVASS